MALIFGILLSYFIGSIPTAYILGKLTKGIDIRKHGSGNVGATNAFRVLGPAIGITVLALDALKGVVCVVLVSDFILSRQRFFSYLIALCLFFGVDRDPFLKHYASIELLTRILCGVIAVLGHSFTIFLRFKGGKGMAATLGVMIGLSLRVPALWIILMIEVLIWLVVFWVIRIVSLASIVSAVFFPVFFIILKQPMPLILMGLTLAIFVILRHKSNIYRLLHNQEPRLNLRRKP